MITYEQALKDILKNTHTLPTEKILTEESVGRILKEDVRSMIEMPPFDKSLMDGYAVRAEDIKRVPAKLKNIGFIQAGKIFKKGIRHGECVKIMTGAALAKNADSVVMVEHTQQCAAYVEIKKSSGKWSNVSFRGEDFKKGQTVLEKGHRINIADIALLASAGKRVVCVSKKPTVAILNTGGEIIPAGARLSKGQIYNSNGPQLLSLLKSDGIRPCNLGIAKDEPRALAKAMKRGLTNEVFLISGGVSVGDYDLVPGILKSLGVQEIFHNVRTKPGKPLFFGKRNRTIVFGIPGNPVSTFVAYFIYIRPALYKMMGRKPYGPRFEEGIIDKEFRHKPGRKHFVPARLAQRAHRYYVTPLESHGSADIFTLSRADAFMVVDADISVVKKSSIVRFIQFQ